MGDRGKTAYTLAGFAAILFWSTSVPLARGVSEKLGHLHAAALIQLIGGLLGLAFAARQRGYAGRVRALPIKYLFVCGALFVSYMFFYYYAIGGVTERSQVLETGLLNYLWPALTLLFSVPLLKKRARAGLVPGMVMALAGVVLAVNHGSLSGASELFLNLCGGSLFHLSALSAAVVWGLYSNFSRRFAGAEEEGAVPLFMIASFLVIFPLTFLFPETPRWSPAAAGELVAISLFSALGYVLWEAAMRNGDMVLVSSASFFTPLLSTLLSGWYLGVPVGAGIWAACAFIIIGAVICRRSISG